MKSLLCILILILPLASTARAEVMEEGAKAAGMTAASLAGSSLPASDPVACIRKALLPFEVLKGNFSQVKTIRVLKKPLKSEGDFALAKGKGLIWRPSKPLPSVLLITRDDIAGIKDGKKAVYISMKEQPALRVIGKVLFAVFGADVDELQKYFEFIKPSCMGNDWRVTLKPKDPSVAKAVSEIWINGAKTVHTLVLVEANGDQTSIKFSGVTEKKPLSKDEEALFE
jgi:hypothetical protein